MAVKVSPNVNASILESLRSAPVSSGPPLTPAGQAKPRTPSGSKPGGGEATGRARNPRKQSKGEPPKNPVRVGRVGRRAPDQPDAGAGSLARGAGFTLYPKDNQRIENAITALRNRGFTSGINRSTIARLALMNLPKGEADLARLFEVLRRDK